MKNKRRRYYVIFGSLLIIAIVTCVLYATKTPVGSGIGAPNKDDALQIAAVEVKTRYADIIDLDKYVIKVKEDKENNQWIVYYILKAQHGEWIIGGGGPEVIIDKKTGEIVSIGLAK